MPSFVRYNVDEELKKLDKEDNEQVNATEVNTMNINRRDTSELSKSVSVTSK